MFATACNSRDALTSDTQAFYRRAIDVLRKADVPFLVGGAYGLAAYTGVLRHTKDFDIFLRDVDVRRALRALALAGYRTELTFAHWLGKAYDEGRFIDLIFSSGNGVAKVDDAWFQFARPARILDEAVHVCPAEETIWSKSFVAERERYDGADVNHLLLCCGESLDWQRLLWRFGPHWRVLLSHLILFGFVYPSERDALPAWVLPELTRRLHAEARTGPAPRRVCQGTLLSRTQYLMDLEEHFFQDARLDAEAGMSAEESQAWTEAGFREGKTFHAKDLGVELHAKDLGVELHAVVPQRTAGRCRTPFS